MVEVTASPRFLGRRRLLARAGRRELVTFAALAFFLAFFLRPADWGATSQLALTEALAHGTPTIDNARDASDPIWGQTGDIGVWRGHLYSDKAPGFAFLSVPAYAAARGAGAQTRGNPRRIVWLLGLVMGVAPALGLLLLVRRGANALEPGTGMATATILGTGTMLAGTGGFVSHALAALLPFAAFLLVLAARERERADGLILAAGLLAGYGALVEYPDALVTAILAVVVVTGRQRLRRVALYCAAVVVALLPLALYDRWAFGSVFRYSRSSAVLTTPHNDVHHGIGGVGWPSVHGAVRILFDHRFGLLVQSPVLALALAGLVLLYRSGRRLEALVCAAVFGSHLVYLSGFFDPWGGRSSGPRYLIPALPFLALGLAPLLRRVRAATLALALVSIAVQALILLTGARIWPDEALLTRLRREEFLPAAFNPVPGVHPLANVLPWLVAVLLLAVLLVTDPGVPRRAVD